MFRGYSKGHGHVGTSVTIEHYVLMISRFSISARRSLHRGRIDGVTNVTGQSKCGVICNIPSDRYLFCKVIHHGQKDYWT